MNKLYLKIFSTKIMFLVSAITLYLILVYLLDYNFKNIIYNAIIVYISTTLFFMIFNLGFYHFMYDVNTSLEDIRLNKVEFEKRKIEFQFLYPKIYFYNKIIAWIDVAFKLVAWIILFFGILKYI
jgi:hypothetical protein